MDAETWAEVEALFERAVDLQGEARRELLGGVRARAPGVVAEVERLLRKDEAASDTFLESLERGAWFQREDPMLGRSLGPYRLVERLAAGGMGVVYRAERTDGLFERDVAVKLIRAERASEGAVQRFELERRALASLDHPHIARLYDGGATEEGSPFLVMELVRGLPIDRYCDERRLPVAERLQLFAAVCRAVDFAHRSLVVHRDLKPSNVLVDEHGEPKLLDFGIARLLDDDADPPAATRTVARALTPEYASPEQLAGGPVTTSIDVYSLGVMLYELLAGSKPFEFHSQSPVDWQRVIAERQPERPSDFARRVPARPGGELDPEALAARRCTSPSGLRRLLRGDLDRIVLMALRKEPERRYPSAQALAADLERHLAGLPVTARSDSFGYRAAKFTRRHRLAVLATALAVVGTFAVLVATWRGERRALAEAEHARIEAETLEGVAEFVMETFLTSDLARDEERRQGALERVGLQADRVRRQHPDRPHLRANLIDSLGRIAQRLLGYEQAEALIREALDLRERTFGGRSLEYALSLRSLALLHVDRGEPLEGARLLEQALLLHRTLEPGTHTDVATLTNDLAVCRRRLGDLEEAERLHLEALSLRRAGGVRSLPVAESLNNLAGIHLDRGQLGSALEMLEEALAIRRAVLTSRHALTLQSMANLAIPTWRSGRQEEAVQLLEEAIAGLRRLRGAGSEALARTLTTLAGMEIATGRLESARARLEEALDLEQARLGPEHPSLAGLLSRLGLVQRRAGLLEEARRSLERAVELSRSPSGSPRDLASALYGFGCFLLALPDLGAAEAALGEARAILRPESAIDPLLMGRTELALGECLAAQGRGVEASAHLMAAVAALEAFPDVAPERDRAAHLLEELRGAEGR